jgi:hypothetical protein
VVFDGNTGDVTEYHQNGPTENLDAFSPTRAQLAALPLDADSLIDQVNSLYASFDQEAGLDVTDAETLFTLNAEQVVLNPLTPPSVRYATYVALAADDELTLVATGVKDSKGRAGVKIYTSLGVSDTDQSEISYIFDPATLLPLEDSLLDETGAVMERQTILSLTTSATFPSNPYGT